MPTWAAVAAVDWGRAPDDWEHVALASYADQLPEFWEPGHAAEREAVVAYLERRRARAAGDYPRSRLFRGRARRRGAISARRARRAQERAEWLERERRSRDARAQSRDGHGRFRRRDDAA